MNYISAESVSKSFLEQPLFKDITLGISKGQKVALVGKNGSGKTTLLNILAGKLEPEGGNVVIRKDIKTAYLDQNPLADAKGTVEEIIYTGNSEIIKTIRDYEECVADPSKADKFNEVLERMESLNAWDFEQNAKQILTKLGIDNFSQQVESLSGGQKKRVALAKVLLEEPDLLILDEPTNHLDLESIEWLEQLLSTNNGTLLLVTHDRYFLDKVCNEIVELDNEKRAGVDAQAA
ncbi:MAG: ATP-binding cassette domain-containing protein [Cytophagaceae bacterium]